MTAQYKHELSGNLREHPLFELLSETAQAKLTGSFRLTIDKEKIIIYLNEGEVIYAVSNARKHRLFEFLLREKKIYKAQLGNIENFVNDIALGKALIEQLFISKEELDEYYRKQVEGIVRYSLTLNEGFWTFNPLIRIKESINYQINVRQMLLDFARGFPSDEIFSRFDLAKETFRPNPKMPTDLNLNNQEGFLFSRFDQTPLKINELQAVSGLPDKITVQILFTLWLGGFIFREVWDSAFSKEYKAEMFAAKVVKIEKEPDQDKEKTLSEILESHEEKAEPEKEVEVEEIEVDEQTLLENYLERVENSTNFYDALGLTPETTQAEIKQTYFGFAKKYHPDLFHSQNEEGFTQRIQNAFSKIAHAYDTLKNDETREVYNFKMRKELAKSETIQGMKTTHDAVEAEISAE